MEKELDIKKIFLEGFVYSEGDRVNIVKVLDSLKVTDDKAKGMNFKSWGIEHDLIDMNTKIEHEGRSYYLVNYKDKTKKTVDFRNFDVMSVMSNSRKIKDPTSPQGSIGNTSMKNEPIDNIRSPEIKDLVKLIDKQEKVMKKMMKKLENMEESIKEIGEENRKYTNCMRSKKYLLKKLQDYYSNDKITIEVKERVNGRNYKRNIDKGIIGK